MAVRLVNDIVNIDIVNGLGGQVIHYHTTHIAMISLLIVRIQVLSVHCYGFNPRPRTLFIEDRKKLSLKH